MGSELFNVLENLAQNGYGLEVLSRLKHVSSSNEIRDYMLGIFHKLIFAGLADEVIAWLPSYKHGDQLTTAWSELYKKLALVSDTYQHALVEQAVIGLPATIDFNNIDDDLVLKIDLLLATDPTFIQDVLNKFTKKIDVLLIDPTKLDLLKNLFEAGYGDYLIKLIKPSTRKIAFGYYSTSFLVYLLDHGYDKQALLVINAAAKDDRRGGSFLNICEALVKNNKSKILNLYVIFYFDF